MLMWKYWYAISKMDQNKLKKLKEVNYSIRKCCGICEHALLNFFDHGDVWGDCKLHKYEHLKHTDKLRKLSINQFGCCDDFEWNEYIKDGGLNNWTEFIEK